MNDYFNRCYAHYFVLGCGHWESIRQALADYHHDKGDPHYFQ